LYRTSANTPAGLRHSDSCNAAQNSAIVQAGAKPNATLPDQEPPLMTASRTGSAAIVRALLARGADVQAAESSRGQTALMWSASEGHVDVMRVLLDANANVAAKSKAGFTPLMFAARGSNVEAVATLVKAGANLNDVATDGTTALIVATVRGQVDVAKLLLDRRVNHVFVDGRNTVRSDRPSPSRSLARARLASSETAALDATTAIAFTIGAFGAGMSPGKPH